MSNVGVLRNDEYQMEGTCAWDIHKVGAVGAPHHVLNVLQYAQSGG